MRARQTVKVTAILVSIVLAGIGSYLALRLRVGDLVERLVQDANTIVGAPRTRLLHVDNPEPGTLGQMFAEHLASIEQAWKAQNEDEVSKAALRAVLDGERPLAEVPAHYLETLARVQADLDAVLRASRAERADLASSEHGFDPAPGVTWAGVHFATQLAGLRVRQAVDAGRTIEAVDDCLDGLALARDAAIAGGLIGRMVSVMLIERLTPTCATVLNALPESSLPGTLDRVRRVRNAMPGFDVTMREEAVQVQLYAHGPQLGADFLGRLADRPRLMAKGFGGLMDAKSWSQRILERWLWRDCRALFDEMIAASALTGPERDAAFESLAERVDGEASFVAEGLPQPRDYLRYAQRAEAGLLRLDSTILAAAARSYRLAKGSWPAKVEALREANLLRDEEQRRLSAAQLVADGNGLLITIPLPSWSDDAPKEARVRLGE